MSGMTEAVRLARSDLKRNLEDALVALEKAEETDDLAGDLVASMSIMFGCRPTAYLNALKEAMKAEVAASAPRDPAAGTDLEGLL